MGYISLVWLLTLRIQLQQICVFNAHRIVIVEIDLDAVDAVFKAKDRDTRFN